MTYTYIQNRVVRSFALYFGVEKRELDGIHTKEDLYRKFDPDSLDEIELVMIIEREFNIGFYKDEYVSWTTLEDILNDIASKCKVDTPSSNEDKPTPLELQVVKQEKEIKALQEQLKEYNELKDTLKRFING